MRYLISFLISIGNPPIIWNKIYLKNNGAAANIFQGKVKYLYYQVLKHTLNYFSQCPTIAKL